MMLSWVGPRGSPHRVVGGWQAPSGDHISSCSSSSVIHAQCPDHEVWPARSDVGYCGTHVPLTISRVRQVRLV